MEVVKDFEKCGTVMCIQLLFISDVKFQYCIAENEGVYVVCFKMWDT